jgi:hypothetical protein
LLDIDQAHHYQKLLDDQAALLETVPQALLMRLSHPPFNEKIDIESSKDDIVPAAQRSR